MSSRVARAIGSSTAWRPCGSNVAIKVTSSSPKLGDLASEAACSRLVRTGSSVCGRDGADDFRADDAAVGIEPDPRAGGCDPFFGSQRVVVDEGLQIVAVLLLQLGRVAGVPQTGEPEHVAAILEGHAGEQLFDGAVRGGWQLHLPIFRPEAADRSEHRGNEFVIGARRGNRGLSLAGCRRVRGGPGFR